MVVEVLRTVICALIDDPDTVRITKIEGDSLSVLEVKVSRDDIGKLIGRHGKTADALRTLVNCISAKNNQRYILQIVD